MFANVSEVALGSDLGKYLREFPIAQMFCNGDDLTQGEFRLWRPKVWKFDATVSMEGPMEAVYENKIGIVAKQETYQYTQCTLDIEKFDSDVFPIDVRGEYNLSTNCGQPFDCLFVQNKSMKDPDKRGFIFLDHKLGHGNPSSHPIVFADNTRKLECGEHREIKARFAKKFRFPTARANRNEDDQQINDYTLDSTDQRLEPHEMHAKVSTSIFVDGTWGTFSGICLNKNDDHVTTYWLLPS